MVKFVSLLKKIAPKNRFKQLSFNESLQVVLMRHHLMKAKWCFVASSFNETPKKGFFDPSSFNERLKKGFFEPSSFNERPKKGIFDPSSFNERPKKGFFDSSSFNEDNPIRFRIKPILEIQKTNF
eukprot:TRINITY_DN694_c0_g1_i1.p3 TRINITY_DN694_c0_g1~~TRINITY_DN694_c0_g1_i1.p3  ORF type:complete len:125 (+),score=18.13 TRINITY_DN694_c0_g1_i1:295-669(+)